MRNSRNVLGVLLLVVLGLLAVAEPATAHNSSSQYGTLKASDITTNGTTCVTEVITFVPADNIVDWSLNVDVDNTTSIDSFPSLKFDAQHLTRTMRLCPGQQPTGDYRLDGLITGNLAPTPAGEPCCAFSSGYNAWFTFRAIDRKPSALTVNVARSHSTYGCPLRQTKHCSLVKGKLKRAGKPLAGAYVDIQTYQHRRWVHLRWDHTDGLGRVAWYVVIGAKEKHLKFRLHFARTDYAKGSLSRTFTVLY